MRDVLRVRRDQHVNMHVVEIGTYLVCVACASRSEPNRVRLRYICELSCNIVNLFYERFFYALSDFVKELRIGDGYINVKYEYFTLIT